MIKKRFWIFLFLSSFISIWAGYPNFEDNPLLTKKMQAMMEPYLLPLDHPAREALDLIFSRGRVVQDEQSLRHAGFSVSFIGSRSAVIVARHHLVPGMIFKIYRDSDPKGRRDHPGWEWLTQRCVNAKKMRDLIAKYDLVYFKVPEKWLYILPLNSVASPSKNLQPVILLATDMEIENHEETRIAWKRVINRRHLDELYVILKSGYGSTCLISNIPFTKQGTFALVDLEHPKRKFNMRDVEKYFSEPMKYYWRSIID